MSASNVSQQDISGNLSSNAIATSRPVLITKDSPYAEFAFFDENAMQIAEQERYSAPLSSTVNVHALPDLPYLRHTIIPLLVPALQEVARCKPKDPIQFLAAYLVSNNPQRDASLPTPSADFPILLGRVPLPQPRPTTPQVPSTPMTSDQPSAQTPSGKKK
eukprot:GDKK01004337.1.p1 GENE.GDKK01004337.1~~GDKK01004337.1.p1  ORF type:complete len:161 (+),score=14.65 GDKK01004337.1:49-531(+)